MIVLSVARLSCGLAILAPIVLALQPTQAGATAGRAAGPPAGTNAPVPPVVRPALSDRLYLRGADPAIVSSGACALLAQAERRDCLEKLPGDIALLRPAASPDPD